MHPPIALQSPHHRSLLGVACIDLVSISRNPTSTRQARPNNRVKSTWICPSS